MASLLVQFVAFLLGPPKSQGRKPPPAPKPRPKSAERLAHEQSILANRRKILANLTAMQQDRASKQGRASPPDKDTAAAADVARRILLNQRDK